MAKIRISIVTETYVPDVNGVANSLRQLLSELKPEQFCIQIIRTAPRSDWLPETEEVWCRGLTIPMYPDLQLGLPARRRVARAWQSFQPDLVYIATEGPLGNSALRQARKQGIPVISAFHTNFHRYSSYYGLGWIKTLTLAWLRRFHNRTAATLVPAGEIASALSSEGFRNVSVLPHGVDCQLFHPRRRSIALRQQWQVGAEPVLLYVGRIAAEKNIPLAIRSWQALRVQGNNARLIMVGDGPMRAELEREHPQIIFAGVQTGETLARYFASADAFIFPSQTETFGLVTLEAMASGLPVVAFNMAAAQMHVQPGVNGELAADDTDEAFIAATSRLVGGDLQAMGIAARLQAERASWQSVAEQFAALASRHTGAAAPNKTEQIQTMV